jgi:phage gp29-like protein
MFVEDHGTPKIDAEISSQLAKQLKDEYHWSDDLILAKIQEATETLRQNGVFTHFEGLKVAALATGNSDTGTTHLDLMNYCDMQNSILLLGHNGSSQATPGKLGNDTTALTILDIRRAAYANFVSNKLNSLLQWIYEINFGAGKAPEIEFYEKSDIATYKAKAEFVQILTATGVQFNDDFYQDEFNIDKKYFKSGPAPAAQIPGKETPPVDPPADDPNVDDPTVDDKQPAKVKNKTAAYMKADVAKDAADDDLITLEKFGEYIQETKDFKDANDTLIDAIVSFVDKANSYEEMLHNLYDLFPNMPIDGLKDMVTRLLLVTRTFGNSTEGAGE